MDKKDRDNQSMFPGELSDALLKKVTGGTGNISEVCNKCGKKAYCQTLSPLPAGITDPNNCTNFFQ